MSWPNASVKNAVPDLATMAMNQGSTRSSIQTKPGKGFKRLSHSAERSRIDSVRAVSPTNIRISGPFSSTPPPIAVHRSAGIVQLIGALGARRLIR